MLAGFIPRKAFSESFQHQAEPVEVQARKKSVTPKVNNYEPIRQVVGLIQMRFA